MTSDISAHINNNYFQLLGGSRVNPSKYDLHPQCLENLLHGPSEMQFRCLHHNINSIVGPSKFDSIRHLVKQYGLDCVGVTETALRPYSVNIYQLPNFLHFSKLRKSGSRGSISLFMHNSLSPTIVQIPAGLDISPKTGHFLAVRSADLIVLLVYRTPSSSMNQFINALESLLLHLRPTAKKFILMGDTNVNLLALNSPSTKRLFSICSSLGLLPAITCPTRVTIRSKTLIDHIWLSVDLLLMSVSSVIRTDTSDHYPCLTFCQAHMPKSTPSSSTQANTRKVFSAANHHIFQEELCGSDWDSILNHHDVNTSTSSFLEHLDSIYHHAFPTVSRRTCNLSPNQPKWMSQHLLQLIHEKRKAFRKHLRSPLQEQLLDTYRTLNKEVKHFVKEAKHNFFRSRLDLTTEPKQSWQLINDELGKSNSPVFFDHITSSNGVCTDQEQICNRINEHFGGVDDHINDVFGPIADLPNILSARSTVCMMTPSIHSVDVELAIKRSKSNNAHCLISIPSSVFKRHAALLSHPISILFNKFLHSKQFPVCLKTSVITPLWKKSRPSGERKLSDLRPIGGMPYLSKLFDGILNSALSSHLEENNIISPTQFGYRRFCSTETALQFLLSTITKASDEGKCVALTSLDVSRAFDSINHRFLLHKLEHCGIRGQLLEFLENYLSERSISTRYNGFLSPPVNYKIGVTQGAPSSSTLFKLFLDDMLSLCLESILASFVDDSNLMTVDDSLNALTSKLNSDLAKVYDWFHMNRLILNPSKSVCVLIARSGDGSSFSQNAIHMNNTPILLAQQTKILGITFDSKLSFKQHIETMTIKLSAAVAMLLKLKLEGYPRNILVAVFRCLLMPHLFYGASIWRAANRAELKRLQVLQNRGIRIIFGLGPRTSTRASLTALKILDIRQIADYATAKMIFANVESKGAHPLLHQELDHRLGGSYSSRAASNRQLFVPAFSTERRRRTIFISGIRYYNSLPTSIRLAPSLAAFKGRLTRYLHENHDP
jgi:exonuclease III